MYRRTYISVTERFYQQIHDKIRMSLFNHLPYSIRDVTNIEAKVNMIIRDSIHSGLASYIYRFQIKEIDANRKDYV